MFAFDEPFGSSVFCDDIRSEVDGKSSYIGVYAGGLSVKSFPAALPKFGIVVFFHEPREWAFQRDWSIALKIFMPGDADDKPTLIGEIPPVPKQTLEDLAKLALPDEEDVPKLVSICMNLLMSPLMLKQPGRIKVRAFYRENIIKLGTLRVEPAPQSSNSSAPPTAS